MAVAIIGDVAGGTAELDQEIMRQLGVSPSSPPPGAMMRLSGPIAGGWRVFTVWDAQESWDAFRRDRLEPLFRTMGREMPSVEVWPLHAMMVQPGAVSAP